MKRLEISADRGGHFCILFLDIGEYLSAVLFSVEFGLMRAFGALSSIFDFFGASMLI